MPRDDAPPPVVGQPDHLYNVWLPGRPHHGTPSRGHAIVGVPESPAPVPGIVLLHGGGGTAYWAWVEQWVARGYAAIAVDTSWRTPVTGDEHGDPTPHEWSGPAPWDGTFAQPVEGDEQWLVHALQLIDEARRHLAVDDRVDAERIALMGVSWGGFLTCIASAAVPGFACAVSVYGSGFLTDDSMWIGRGSFDQLDPAQVAAWSAAWDPSSHLGKTSIPMLFLTGVNDYAYPLISVERSAALVPRAGRSFLPVLAHSHSDAWVPVESERFVDAMLRDGPPFPRILDEAEDGPRVRARVESDGLVRAVLLHTTDDGEWEHRRWEQTPAERRGDVIESVVPADATAWFLNVTDRDEATASSRLFQR